MARVVDESKRLAPTEHEASELRLLLEELCCDLCHFVHARDGLPPEAVAIDREAWLGVPRLFADIVVRPRGQAAYAVEVKHGYADEMLVEHLGRKYGSHGGAGPELAKVLLVVDLAQRANWSATL